MLWAREGGYSSPSFGECSASRETEVTVCEQVKKKAKKEKKKKCFHAIAATQEQQQQSVEGIKTAPTERTTSPAVRERERDSYLYFPFHPPHTHNNFSFLFSFFSFSSFSSFSSFKIYFNGRTSFPCISLTGDLLPGYTNLLLLLLLLFLILIALFEQFVVFSSSSCLLLQWERDETTRLLAARRVIKQISNLFLLFYKLALA